MKNDIYAAITNQIIEDLEKGIIPWRRTWSTAKQGCFSYTSKKRYSVLNTLLLGAESGEYVTFKGAQDAGGYVRKGEKARTVVFWSMLNKKAENDEETDKTIPYLREYKVFNINQCEGITPHDEFVRAHYENCADEEAEKVIKDYVNRSGITFNATETNNAYYSLAQDSVVIPARHQYQNSEEYYATAFHELAHSTGAEKRLNRLEKGTFASESYSREELVAELASAFLMNICGLDSAATFENSEAYIAGWLSALRNDKRLVVSAASRAEKAVALILGEKETNS